MLLPCALENWKLAFDKNSCDILIEAGGFISFHSKDEIDFTVLEKYNENTSQKIYPTSKDALKFLFFDSKIGGTTCGKIYRREKLGHLRFPVGIHYAEDSTYYLELFHQTVSWCVVDFRHYCYRRNREGSHSSTISPKEKVTYFKNSVDHLVLLNEMVFSQKECSNFWKRSLGGTMQYVLGGPEECWNCLDSNSQQEFRLAARRAKHFLGYYPFPWTMRVRVEILRGHFEKCWRLFEVLWYGTKRRIVQK